MQRVTYKTHWNTHNLQVMVITSPLLHTGAMTSNAFLFSRDNITMIIIETMVIFSPILHIHLKYNSDQGM